MNGRFYYTNNAVMVFACIVGVAGSGVLAASVDLRYDIDSREMGSLSAPLILFFILALSKIPCSYSVDGDGIVIRRGFITRRINTSDIISFSTENRKNGHSRNGGTFFLYVLTIHTKQRDYTLREDCGLIHSEDFLSDPEGVRIMLNNTELSRLAEFIAQQTGERENER